jgi:signal transduction histidine kinase
VGSATRRPTGDAREAALSVQGALWRYMKQSPHPFAITRGARHDLVYANTAFCRLPGVANIVALGDPIANMFIGNEKTSLITLLNQAFRSGVELLDRQVETSSEAANGWTCSVWPVIADDGKPEALGIELREVEVPDSALDLQRQVAEQMLLGALRERGIAEDAEAARRRATFLAEAGRVLAESVDQTSTLITLTKLALPAMGAWCIVDILGAENAIQRLGIFHPDPEKQKLAHEMEVRWMPKSDDPFGAAAMLMDARTNAINDNIDATLAAAGHSPEDLDILHQLGAGPLLTVPLVARGKLLGAITFVSAQRGVPYTAADVHLAEDLANRAALALDNAQLYDLALVLKGSAETANRAKTAFLGALSHELRTPLNAIGGYVELLDMGLRGPVTAEQHADFARVKTNQQHLLVLITQLLNFVRVGSGQVSYSVLEIDAKEALTGAVELIEPLFAQKGLVWDGIKCDTALVVRADPEKVTQILVNLLSNAIKFTPAGGRISGECEAKDDNILLRVTDTGIGIAADKLEAIFEPFVQVKESLANRESGVGLGLAISRDLARAMQGDLTVESVEGKGARFTLTLPGASDAKGGTRTPTDFSTGS